MTEKLTEKRRTPSHNRQHLQLDGRKLVIDSQSPEYGKRREGRRLSAFDRFAAAQL